MTVLATAIIIGSVGAAIAYQAGPSSVDRHSTFHTWPSPRFGGWYFSPKFPTPSQLPELS
jgi:hypothetical protein